MQQNSIWNLTPFQKYGVHGTKLILESIESEAEYMIAKANRL